MSVKENVLKMLTLSEDFISGQELAQMLNVSRNAVWKAVKALENEGCEIEAINNKGYKLKNNYILSEKLISDKLNTQDYGKNIVILNEVDSTNNYAKKLVSEGALNGTVVISDYQSAGKGRMGRSFYSPKGMGLYISIIIKPDMDMSSAQLITSCVAVAVAEAIEKLCETDVKIKWVNDLFIGEKKLCGILTEASMSFEEKKLDYAIVGIGINIRTPENIPDELKSIITSIESETDVVIDRNSLCAEILNIFEGYITNLKNSRDFIEKYRQRSFIFGKNVLVNKNGTEKIGTAIDIDENINLIVELENGQRISVNSGEARIIK